MEAAGGGSAGDDHVRHCGKCDLDVFNLSNMGREAAEALLAAHRPGERLCAGYYKRADGTILIKDCPVGLAAARRRAGLIVSRVAAAVALLFTGGIMARATHDGALRDQEPFWRLSRLVRGQPMQVQQQWIGGIVCPAWPASGSAAQGSQTPTSGGNQ
jgi:hypothetical protein